jgi:hypothetical protein
MEHADLLKLLKTHRAPRQPGLQLLPWILAALLLWMFFSELPH